MRVKVINSSGRYGRAGICSTYLAKAVNHSEIAIWVQRKERGIESLQCSSVILIGTGTGIAPIISYLNGCKDSGRCKFRSIYIYYGCRHRVGDNMLGEEYIEGIRKALPEVEIEVFYAFSQEGDKKYVQDVLKENRGVVPHILQGEGGVYISGRAKRFPHQILYALAQCLPGNADRASIEYVDNLRFNHKLILDVW